MPFAQYARPLLCRTPSYLVQNSCGYLVMAPVLYVTGDVSHQVEDEAAVIPTIRFVENTAGGLGGAMHVVKGTRLVLRDVSFESNHAKLGGAVYVLAVAEGLTTFSGCVFEGNTGSEGGALYLATGSALDRFDGTIFRDNTAGNQQRLKSG